MNVYHQYKQYEREILQLLTDSEFFRDLVPIIASGDELLWNVIDGIDSDYEDTNKEELITTLISFAYPDRTKLFYDGFANGEIPITPFNGLFREILKILHTPKEDLEKLMVEDYRELGRNEGIDYEQYKTLILSAREQIKNKIKTSADMTKMQMMAMELMGGTNE
ncbi:MAG: hypothetical protein HOP21_07115 [Methylotenera sp.]|nr:hypothetical protein [Methylotenera sp.]